MNTILYFISASRIKSIIPILLFFNINKKKWLKCICTRITSERLHLIE